MIKAKIIRKKDYRPILKRMPDKLRNRQLSKAYRKGGTIVARQTRKEVPPPGYPGDKPGKKPLKRTITTRTKIYKRTKVVMAIVGPRYPEGAHGHLVERGHRIVRKASLFNRIRTRIAGKHRTEPNPFMKRAVRATRTQQHSAIVQSLRADLPKLVR